MVHCYLLRHWTQDQEVLVRIPVQAAGNFLSSSPWSQGGGRSASLSPDQAKAQVLCATGVRTFNPLPATGCVLLGPVPSENWSS